ncbi:hypothetical protein L1987_74870 [Smallanthus sonchifolius]|uniref:Uncharacterized protein n=1 Tax=Smallanthus sonchifolius TaxID=185202 RepID=A0ACB9A5I2_9ASTR|nr:hypothetical protein L1987_74870 [Smallanthus sonchifolius]
MGCNVLGGMVWEGPLVHLVEFEWYGKLCTGSWIANHLRRGSMVKPESIILTVKRRYVNIIYGEFWCMYRLRRVQGHVGRQNGYDISRQRIKRTRRRAWTTRKYFRGKIRNRENKDTPKLLKIGQDIARDRNATRKDRKQEDKRMHNDWV